MQIPLDYYRILKVPIKATPPQIQQAYEDSDRQRPYQDFSQTAVMARKHLLEQAYQVLIDPEKRSVYDRQFLATTKSIDPTNTAQQVDLPFATPPAPPVSSSPTSYLEIPPQQSAGALLLLYELGEYERVIKIALSQRSEIKTPTEETARTLKQDLVLILALSYLESSREQWQQNQLRQAEASGEAALKLLRAENLFPQLEAQVERQIKRLRPYRIIELVALPLEKNKLRQQGIELLQQMLEERQGIDGKGDDGSGWGIDRFLIFMQKLRQHLTIAEQEYLFEQEARRPSAAAAFLAVYTYLADGFVNKEPQKIVLAREKLTKISPYQDVYVELAVCELLLANPPAAQRAIEQTQEQEALDFIQEHSQDAVDLLPGLYVYADGWLQSEVCSQFRDGKGANTTIRSYFTNRQVQQDLETLFAQAESTTSSQTQTESTASGLQRELEPYQQSSNYGVYSTADHAAVGQTNGSTRWSGSTATLEMEAPPSSGNKYQSQLGFDRANATGVKPQMAQTIRRIKRKRSHRKTIFHPSVLIELGKKAFTQASTSIRRQPSRNRNQWLIGGGALLVGLGAVVVAANWLNSDSETVVITPPAELELNLIEPIINLSELESSPNSSTSEALSTKEALTVVRRWFEAKAMAYGIDHQPEQLSKILAEPLRSQQTEAAQNFKQNNVYRQFEHRAEIKSVDYDPTQPDRAIVTAQVKEVAKYYQNDRLIPARSYDDSLLVRYQLVRQPEGWMIKAIEVI